MRVTRDNEEENLESSVIKRTLKEILLFITQAKEGAKSYRVFLFTLQTHPLSARLFFIQAALALELYS